MPIPFGGEPLVSQLAAASSAVAAATSGAIPSSFAQILSLLNTTRECNPILSSSFLDSASSKALDYVANQIWSSAALDNLSVCSNESIQPTMDPSAFSMHQCSSLRRNQYTRTFLYVKALHRLISSTIQRGGNALEGGARTQET